jgi:hypothetical protein
MIESLAESGRVNRSFFATWWSTVDICCQLPQDSFKLTS